MTPSEPDSRTFDDRRKSHRYVVNGPRRNGRIRLGLREVAVEILDESASGVAIAFDGPPGCEPGARLLLEIASGWIEVQVMNIRREESKPAEAGQEPVERTRLGLLRLRDLEPGEADPQRIYWLSLQGFKTVLAPLMPVGRPLRSAAVLIIGVPLFAVVLVWALESFEWSLPLDDEHVAQSAPPLPDAHFRTTRPRAEGFPKPTQRDRPEVDARPEEPQQTLARELEVAAEKVEPVPDEIIRRSRPDYMLRPEISRLLALSQEQLRQLRLIWVEYQAALTNAIAAGISSPTIDWDLRFGRRTMAVLTQEQIAALQRLLSTEAVENPLGANVSTSENTPRGEPR